MTDTASVARAISEVENEYGAVDVLVNVAGILRPGLFLDDTRETWESVISTHVGGHLNTINAVLPGMLSRQRGRIINVTSTPDSRFSSVSPPIRWRKKRSWGSPVPRHTAREIRNYGQCDCPERSHAHGHRTPRTERPQTITRISSKTIPLRREFRRLLWTMTLIWSRARTFLVSGNYVVEYEHLRPWKWAATTPDAADIQECVRWILGRPHPTLIGPWPTRDFRLLTVERNWEGTSFNPDLDDGAEPKVPTGGSVSVRAFGQVPKEITNDSW